MRAYSGDTEARSIYSGGTLVWPRPVTRPETTSPPADGNVFFDADFAGKGFSQYKNTHPQHMEAGVDYGLASDPAGTGSIVAWTDSWRGLTEGNSSDRAELETGYLVKSSGWGNTDSRYAQLTRVWFPTKAMFATAGGWSLIMEAHGPPFVGPASTSLQVSRNADGTALKIRQADDATWLGDVTIPVGQWVSLLMVWQHDDLEHGGCSELLVNTSGSLTTGWTTLSARAPRNMIKNADTFFLNGPGPGSYPASCRYGCYGSFKGRMYWSHHRLARTARAALGPSWDGLVDGNPYEESVQSSTQRT